MPHKKIPYYLKKYIVDQNYSKYTFREHATWKYLMRISKPLINKFADSSYIEALNRLNISEDRIPNILDLNKYLSKYGWTAVCVDGFIPPNAFFDFQARGFLPVSASIRPPEQILYTPAPDIFHEIIGHAPLLTNKEYSSFFVKYGKIAKKAIFSKSDSDFFNTVKKISDLKESENYTEAEITALEEKLDLFSKMQTTISESGKMARLYWWTVEYGLIKDKVYGAGLISSIEEIQTCHNKSVKKSELSLDCTKFSYDITKAQKNLFVINNFKHLHTTLDELDQTFSYKVGGRIAVENAINTDANVSVVLDSGLEISGNLTSFESNSTHEISKIFFKDECQFKYNDVIFSNQFKKNINNITEVNLDQAYHLLEPNNSTSTLKSQVAKIVSIYPSIDHSSNSKDQPISFRGATQIDTELDYLYESISKTSQLNRSVLSTLLNYLSIKILSDYKKEWLLASFVIYLSESNLIKSTEIEKLKNYFSDNKSFAPQLEKAISYSFEMCA